MTPRPVRRRCSHIAAIAVLLLLPSVVGFGPAPSLLDRDVWMQTERIVAGDADQPGPMGTPSMAFAFFGWSMDVDGDLLAVGAQFAERVYVFERTPEGWIQQAIIRGNRIGFGYGVGISGDTLVIGSPFESTDGAEQHGAVYVFERVDDEWQQRARLVPDHPRDHDYFGMRLAVDGDAIAVGYSRGYNDAGERTGAVYVYEKTGDAWLRTATIFGEHPLALFGVSLAFGEGFLLAGADRGDTRAPVRSGAVYEYVRGPTGWAFQQKIVPPHPTKSFGAGGALATDGLTMVVGAPSMEPTVAFASSGVYSYPGAAFVFERTSSVGWAFVAEIENPRRALGESFGKAVAVQDELLVIGARDAHPMWTGAAYVFSRSETGWELAAALRGNDSNHGDFFGWTVGVSNGTVLVSAPFDSNRGDGAPPPLDDYGDTPPCAMRGVVWGCDDGEAAGTVYAFRKLQL